MGYSTVVSSFTMNRLPEPTFEQKAVGYIDARLGLKIRDAGRRAGGLMIAARSGYDVVTIKYQADKKQCKVVMNGDILKMPFKKDTFDRIFSMDLTGYEPRLVDIYSKDFRELYPGSMLVSYEWVTTGLYRDDDPEHVEIIEGIKTTLGLPDLRSYSDVAKVAEKVGFEVVEEKGNLVNSQEKPWLVRLKKRRDCCRRKYKAVMILEKLGIVAKSTVDDREMRVKTVDYLIKGGEIGIFNPMHTTLCRKPEKPPQS